MQHLHRRIARAALFAVMISLALSALASAAAPSSATVSPTSGPVSWDGFGSVAAASPDGEATCVEGTTCDTFTLKLAAADYRGKRVRVKASWTNQLNDYDVYVHQGDVNGPVLSPPNGGPPATSRTPSIRAGLVNSAACAGVLLGSSSSTRLTL